MTWNDPVIKNTGIIHANINTFFLEVFDLNGTVNKSEDIAIADAIKMIIVFVE